MSDINEKPNDEIVDLGTPDHHLETFEERVKHMTTGDRNIAAIDEIETIMSRDSMDGDEDHTFDYIWNVLNVIRGTARGVAHG